MHRCSNFRVFFSPHIRTFDQQESTPKPFLLLFAVHLNFPPLADTGSDVCAWDFCWCAESDYVPRSLLRPHGHDASHLEGIEPLLSLCNTNINSYRATAQLKTTFSKPIFELVFPVISKCNAHRGHGGMDWHLGTRSCIVGSSGCRTGTSDISLSCRVKVRRIFTFELYG